MSDENDRIAFSSALKLWHDHVKVYGENDVSRFIDDANAVLKKLPENSGAYNLFYRLADAILDELNFRFNSIKGGDIDAR